MDNKTPDNKAKDCSSLSRADMASTEDAMCFNLASTTETTGMIPTPPLTDAEVEGYEALFYRPQQEADNARKSDSPQEQENKENRP